MPSGAAAQCPIGMDECVPGAPRWVGEFASLSANALLGGITSGVTRALGGGSFRDGFLDGLPGGAAVYAGKRLASERLDGAGLLGRQVAAVGTSMVVNAGEGAALFDRLLLPVGPIRLELAPGSGWSLRLDPAALAWIIYGIAEPELTFDAGDSFSGGTAIFRTSGKLISFDGAEPHAAGVTKAGVVYVADVPAYGGRAFERALTHERIHAIQQDFFAAAWTDPLGRALLGRTRVTRRVAGVLTFNLATELLMGIGQLIPEHRDRPWEIESIFFAR
jgi:hypothetical protein